MKFPGSVIFLVALLMTVLMVDCNPGPPYRRLPFNGSMYGKRTASPLPIGMQLLSFYLGTLSACISSHSVHEVISVRNFLPESSYSISIEFSSGV
jgi:hypothetical protein